MENKQYSKLIVVGSIAFDEIMDYPALFVDQINPEKLHQINISFVVDKMEKRFGGTGTNIIYNFSLLSEKQATLCSGLGKDSDEFMKFFNTNKIDTSGIIFDESIYTAKGTAVTDQKNNQIWGFYYGACIAGKNIDFKSLAGKDSFMVLSATHKDAFMHAQKYAIENKIAYMYDFGMTLSWITNEELQEGIEHCTYLIGNDYEISQIEKKLGFSVDELCRKNKIVITTLGESGVRYQNTHEEFKISAFRTNVVDPTGAGDAWRGGFLAALFEGKSTLESLKQANVLASFAIEKYGTVYHSPSKEDIEERKEKLLIEKM